MVTLVVFSVSLLSLRKHHCFWRWISSQIHRCQLGKSNRTGSWISRPILFLTLFLKEESKQHGLVGYSFNMIDVTWGKALKANERRHCYSLLVNAIANGLGQWCCSKREHCRRCRVRIKNARLQLSSWSIARSAAKSHWHGSRLGIEPTRNPELSRLWKKRIRAQRSKLVQSATDSRYYNIFGCQIIRSRRYRP